MLKQFLIKQLIRSQLSKLPKEVHDMIMSIMEKNPDLLMKIAEDVQAAKAAGKSDQDAFVAIGAKYKDELQNLSR